MKFTLITLMFKNLEDGKQNPNVSDSIKKKQVICKTLAIQLLLKRKTR